MLIRISVVLTQCAVDWITSRVEDGMQIILLSEIETIIVDIFAWVCFHLGIGYWSTKWSIDQFDPKKWLYATRKWEQGGKIYDKIFHVRAWKKFIPSGASLYKNAFRVKNLASSDIEYLTRWLKESCRSELCHWIMMLPGGLFFLWNSVETGWWMVVYAVANNLVPIIMQRYNRPRMERLLAQLKRKPFQDEQSISSLEAIHAAL